jgi:coenzyme PQQ precursor peptide PqqA
VTLRRCRIAGASAGSPISRSFCVRQTVSAGKPNSRPVTHATPALTAGLLVLPKSEVVLSKREVSGGRCVVCPSTSDLPCLRYVRGQPSFDAGTKVVPTLCLGETLMSWKTPKIVEVPVGMEINMYACAARQ